MKALIYTSLSVNILVLTPILILMAIKSPAIEHAWGVPTESQGILMSIYFSIFATSVLLLFFTIPEMVFALLSVQVIYKITTPITVGSIVNPVVISNLVISGLFIVTLISLFPVIRKRQFQLNQSVE